MIYLDHHATTPVDPRVVEAMLPFFREDFGNAGSLSHEYGRRAREGVEQARSTIAECLGCATHEIVFTSGATESNNLAIRGLAQHPRRRGQHFVTVATEHRAVLEPARRLRALGCEVTLLSPEPHGSPQAGWLEPAAFTAALRPDTFLASVMYVNNEIGVIQDVTELGSICRARGIVFHCDATQAVGKIPFSLGDCPIDLMSFTAHKLYGPKGIGALYVRGGPARSKISPLIEGGGQEGGLRSGTLNVAGIVGFAEAVALASRELTDEAPRLASLRDRLATGLLAIDPDISVNGPSLEISGRRSPGNLNVCVPGIEGQTLMLLMPELAISSGSTCSSERPEPSHVLRALGMDEASIRSSLRFCLGRFNTVAEIDQALDYLRDAIHDLRRSAI